MWICHFAAVMPELFPVWDNKENLSYYVLNLNLPLKVGAASNPPDFSPAPWNQLPLRPGFCSGLQDPVCGLAYCVYTIIFSFENMAVFHISRCLTFEVFNFLSELLKSPLKARWEGKQELVCRSGGWSQQWWDEGLKPGPPMPLRNYTAARRRSSEPRRFHLGIS